LAAFNKKIIARQPVNPAGFFFVGKKAEIPRRQIVFFKKVKKLSEV